MFFHWVAENGKKWGVLWFGRRNERKLRGRERAAGPWKRERAARKRELGVGETERELRGRGLPPKPPKQPIVLLNPFKKK